MTRQSAIDSFTEIATLRIELKDSDPLIWRELEVPTSITLKVLHEIVQTAMGWLDYHLWEMVIDHQTYGLPMRAETPREVVEQLRRATRMGVIEPRRGSVWR